MSEEEKKTETGHMIDFIRNKKPIHEEHEKARIL
jgi:hypothetical protein